MPAYLGGTAVSFGGCARAYLGATLVWQAAAEPPAPDPVVYTQAFATDVGGWVAQTNASGVIRDTARYPEGALRWTATANGTARVRRTNVAVQPNSTYRIEAQVSHSGAFARGMQVGVDIFNSSSGYVASPYSQWTTTPAGPGSTTISYQITTGGTAATLTLSMLFHEALAGEYGYLDGITIYGPL